MHQGENTKRSKNQFALGVGSGLGIRLERTPGFNEDVPVVKLGTRPLLLTKAAMRIPQTSLPEKGVACFEDILTAMVVKQPRFAIPMRVVSRV